MEEGRNIHLSKEILHQVDMVLVWIVILMEIVTVLITYLWLLFIIILPLQQGQVCEQWQVICMIINNHTFLLPVITEWHKVTYNNQVMAIQQVSTQWTNLHMSAINLHNLVWDISNNNNQKYNTVKKQTFWNKLPNFEEK